MCTVLTRDDLFWMELPNGGSTGESSIWPSGVVSYSVLSYRRIVLLS